MRKVVFPGKLGKMMLHTMTFLALLGVFILAPVATNNVAAASSTVPINMIYYGWHDATVDSKIINAQPEYLVGNSPAGPWRGNANISKFTAAGIKYFEYIDGGYEGTAAQPIPNDLQSNLNYVNAAAAAGAYGIFLDEVSANPSSTALYYLKQIADRAHSLGLKVVFNTGVDSWSDSLMELCDFMNSSEIWSNAPMSASQNKWASRTWLLTQNVTSDTTAAYLTNAAVSKGFDAHYASVSYGALPAWLEPYVSQINVSTSPPPAPPPTEPPPAPVTGNTAGTVVGTPVATGGSKEYSFNLKITSTTVAGLTVGQQVWVAATTTSFPNLLTSGAAISGTLDKSLGWWVFSSAGTAPPPPPPTEPPPAPVSGNTAGTVVGTPVATGGTNEYSFNLKITSTTVTGLTAGQQVWVAATTTSFPNLLTSGAAISGTLDKSLGWWVIK